MDIHVSDVVWASGITAAALLIQTWLTNLRESRRLRSEASERALDRRQALEVSAQVHKAGIQDHWRDRRLDSYADYLAAVDRLMRSAAKTRLFLKYSRNQPIPDMDEDMRNIIREAWSRVQMLGSQEAVDYGGQAYRASQNLWLEMSNAATLDNDRSMLADRVDDSMDKVNDALVLFQSAARRDIGTLS